MTRFLSLAIAVFFMGAAVLAQTHPQGHPPGRPHDMSGHPPMDPMLHALLHGTWNGTLTAPKGVPGQVALKVETDRLGKDIVEMTGAPSLGIGTVTDVAFENKKLRWQQQLSGKPCQAVADIVPATSNTPDTMKGTMSCGQDQFDFTLTKATK